MKFNKLLIANRGEIARRIIRTAHRLGLQTVAVYSDADAHALHVREATQSIALGGNASADSYLRIDRIIDAAKASGADAVHPGYGFLSENADFAQAVIDAGLVWVGPPPAAIRALGSKSSAKQLAQTRGVPCLPGYFGQDQSDERLEAEATAIGYPLMVKAAAGGGGRGMRLVTQPSQLLAAIQSARSEAQAAFGSGELLLERALLRPRHVELQVFADTHGNCITLGERDCSVQRRHQKLIEESPSPAVDAPMRERMSRSAAELAQSAGYVGAGTVEFLVETSAETGASEFFLMEMNTRLQVEHPVTEAVTGLDLVEWQLRVAQGEPLPLKHYQVKLQGHAIEVRICAEDENFVPRTGTVSHFLPPPLGEGWGGGTRFDHAIFKGMEITPHYDSMLGKLIAHAPTREGAIDQLANALDRLEILGVPTNRRLLAACLRHEVFRSGHALIPFLEEHASELREQLAAQERAVVAEAFRAAQFAGSASSLACPFPRPVRFRHRGEVAELPPAQHGERPMRVSAVALAGGGWHVQAGAVDLVVEDASFEPSNRGGRRAAALELRAPFNGKVVAVKAQAGMSVSRGDTLVIVESMKLEHALAASRDCVVKAVHVEPGQQAGTSQLLVSFEAAS
ncbi:biotin carboxylase N-terminal domain-containing protein [Caenimonas sp. SL110]|uniref:acetyl/propionyl/methylcrotonyl-CoA carboxylase subunit alpha n=1 Tax=Caenimonas sp. SL110 TaxID=1450524 RepID=UPI0006530BD7|nr:biotin carboxylase N-terminal domain-containing protein [Caenimonas sp. SL110]